MISLQSLRGSEGGMFSRFLSLFRRENHRHAETRPRQNEARLQSEFAQKASSQPSTGPVEEERMKHLENLKTALHKMQNERDELRRILAYYPRKNLNDRINFESEMLMMQHQQVMTDLQKMRQQINEGLWKSNQLRKQNQLYCLRYSLLRSESIRLKHNVKRAQNENRELLWEQIALEESIKETARFRVEASMKNHVTSSIRMSREENEPLNGSLPMERGDGGIADNLLASVEDSTVLQTDLWKTAAA
ncbi:uncharacterized protein Dlg5l2 [Rattus norvegicus]|uniref:uncharacterized protein Dlg5l2 n=1 Tax=Rattus norvegicus TaxID=10116 RepID=UPI0003D097FF|nr:uncharacterized protein LOC100911251 [Rattus norvegicus]|eukprot:XP_003749517.2 PREDICTED: uncharacterized protein LOC100911251 isoform X1 [Rattus norvegicus]